MQFGTSTSTLSASSTSTPLSSISNDSKVVIRFNNTLTGHTYSANELASKYASTAIGKIFGEHFPNEVCGHLAFKAKASIEEAGHTVIPVDYECALTRKITNNMEKVAEEEERMMRSLVEEIEDESPATMSLVSILTSPKTAYRSIVTDQQNSDE